MKKPGQHEQAAIIDRRVSEFYVLPEVDLNAIFRSFTVEMFTI